ncbi:hypothetical protein [Formosa sp. PL04]|uniref:hypothetical protein n=1 Tax=Formosa sp. PL04 TaxID=3081755 RepID=UPI002980EA56|nr:hypothetical protein [Formosa sp. PL04]MDW5288051.1 hypothetical protein [Formosa sp. PL04]
MIYRIYSCLFFLLGLMLPIQAQTVSVEFNYNNWKWNDVYVANNKFISVAVVPEAAGRMLEFNLGDVPSLWVNPKLFGESFGTSDEVKMSDWRNFGGYRLVPLPIDNCSVDSNGNKAKRWPPPVVIGDAPYNTEIETDLNGVKSIEVVSGIQDLPVPQFYGKTKSFIYPEKIDEQLQYKRSLHIEQSSSLVHITHTLINKGSETVKRGIMTSSQHVSRTKPELTDGENYVVYVPFDEKYKLPNGQQYEISGTAEARWRYINKNRMPLDKNNPEHVEKYFNHGTNWKGEVAPGIYEIEYDYYLMSGFHVIASKPWMCYVNKTNNTAFVKIFEPYNPSLDYAEGINVSVFCSGLETGYIETEVRTPLYTLAANESFDYKEIQAAAKIVPGPVLDVNTTGIISEKLALDKVSKKATGKYGVFVEGFAILKVLDSKGNTSEIVVNKDVNPLHAFVLNYPLQDLENIFQIQLCVKGIDNKVHVLDTYTVN